LPLAGQGQKMPNKQRKRDASTEIKSVEQCEGTLLEKTEASNIVKGRFLKRQKRPNLIATLLDCEQLLFR
jgi:hypothetical protein